MSLFEWFKSLVLDVLGVAIMAALIVFGDMMCGLLGLSPEATAVILGAIGVMVYQVLPEGSINLYEALIEFLRGRRRNLDDKGGMGLLGYACIAAVLILVVMALYFVVVLRIDVLGVVLGAAAVIMAFLGVSRPKNTPEAPSGGDVVGDTMVYNGIRFVRVPGLTGVWVNDEKGFAYIERRANNVERIIASPRVGMYTVYTDRGLQQECRYDPATRKLYGIHEDMLEEAETKLELLQMVEKLDGASAMRFAMAELGERGVDLVDVKLHLLLPQAVIDEWRAKGILDSYVNRPADQDGMAMAWENYLKNTDPSILKRRAREVLEKYL